MSTSEGKRANRIKPEIKAQFVREFMRRDPRCFWCQAPVVLTKTYRAMPPEHRRQFRVATLDHVLPASRGGSNDRKNLVLACKDCNQARGGDPPRWAAPSQPLATSVTLPVMPRIFVAHDRGVPDAQLDAWKVQLQQLIGDSVEVVLGRDDFQQRAQQVGGWEAWARSVVHGLDSNFEPLFTGIVRPGPMILGKATAEIIQAALGAGLPVVWWHPEVGAQENVVAVQPCAPVWNARRGQYESDYKATATLVVEQG